MRHLFTLLFLALAACNSTPPALKDDDGPKSQVISVLSNGWHTAIILPGPKVRETGLLPESADFPEAAFLEFGWGDEVYYPAKDPTFEMAWSAAMTPTPAVMHVAVRSMAPYSFDNFDVIELSLSEKGFRHLLEAIANEFERPEGGRAASVSAGLYPESHFYKAKGEFHIFNTCNTWTARMLQAGGVNISPSGISTANELMDRLGRTVGSA